MVYTSSTLNSRCGLIRNRIGYVSGSRSIVTGKLTGWLINDSFMSTKRLDVHRATTYLIDDGGKKIINQRVHRIASIYLLLLSSLYGSTSTNWNTKQVHHHKRVVANKYATIRFPVVGQEKSITSFASSILLLHFRIRLLMLFNNWIALRAAYALRRTLQTVWHGLGWH